MRFWTRRGHGIHSPWVYTLVTEVIRQTDAYYAYDELPDVSGWARCELQLLFRLANHFQPSVVMVNSLPDPIVEWIKAGCSNAQTYLQDSLTPGMIMSRPDGVHLYICPTPQSALWQQLVEQHDGIYIDRRKTCLCYQGLNIPTQYHRI